MDVAVVTTVSVVDVTLSTQEARDIGAYLGGLVGSIPTAVRELARRLNKAVEKETFNAPVQ